MKGNITINLAYVIQIVINGLAICGSVFIAYRLVNKYKKKTVYNTPKIDDEFIDEEQLLFTEEELEDINRDVKANLECAIEGSNNIKLT
jgi:large-conductance mechanosensitive channel